MSETTQQGQFEFKAEIKQLLDILVHSLYTNQEIFVRELISNASDALDKLRFEQAKGSEAADSDLPLEIHVDFDEEKNILTISDTGIGMTRDEVISNIGTIAKSGSADFLKQASDQKESLDNLIGKFGVGFYSVFMAASEVVIRTRSFNPSEEAVVWRSDGLGTYTLEPAEGEIKRGTNIEVHLKEEAKEFSTKHRLDSIIKRHSNFISFPIFLGDDQINTIPALWREPKFNVKDEQYNEFYKFLSFDQEEPLSVIHVSIDAPVQYNALLFIPKRDVDPLGMTRERPGLDLYIRRVLIQKGNKDLVPEHIGFVRGVVDSEDLPLNISRESIQENALVHKISSNITRQVLKHLQKMADEDNEKYETFWREHGRLFRMGYNDFANREKYAPLLRFNSSKCEDAKGLVSLDEYIAGGKSDQKEIYYATGPSREAVALNPHMEIFKAKGLEVLYLLDPLEEFAMDALREYKEWTFQSVEHASPETLEKYESEAETDKAEPLSSEDEGEFGKFMDRIKDVLGDKITEAKVSVRLSGSPCCLASPDGGLTSSMQKIMQIAGKDNSIPTKIFEVNKDHRLVRNLFSVFKKNPQDDYLTTALEQLFESALLQDGYLKDPHEMVRRMQKILNQSSGWYLDVTGRG